MSASLPELPTEILLKIIESVDDPEERLELFKRIRLSCRKVHDKTLYYFGSRYVQTIRAILYPGMRTYSRSITQLECLSRGPMATHVISLAIDTDTFVKSTKRKLSSADLDDSDGSDNSDTSCCSWFESGYEHQGYGIQRSFDERPVDYIMSGQCGEEFGQALSRFPNLKHLVFYYRDIIGVKADKCQVILARWSLAFKTLLSAALSNHQLLESITVDRENALLSLSILDSFAIFMQRLPMLRGFELILRADGQEAVFSEYSRIIDTLLKVVTPLKEVGLGFQRDGSSTLFFKQLTSTLQRNNLTALRLYRLETHVRELRQFLRKCKHTLLFLSLNHIGFLKTEDSPFIVKKEDLPFTFIRNELKLKECILNCLEEGSAGTFFHGICFNRISRDRPVVARASEPSKLEDEDWIVVEKNQCKFGIRLCAEEGDDIGYWMDMAEQFSERVRPWDPEDGWFWDFRYYSPETDDVVDHLF